MMKEFCFGLAIGTLMGVLMATNSNKVTQAVKDVEKVAAKKAKDIKNKVAKNKADNSHNDEQTEEE